MTNPDTFNVSAAWDKSSYNKGDTITGTISGGDVLTTTSTSPPVTVGPVSIPLVAADGATSTATLAPVTVNFPPVITTTPESVVIDTTKPIVDNGPNPRTWVVSSNKLSITAIA